MELVTLGVSWSLFGSVGDAVREISGRAQLSDKVIHDISRAQAAFPRLFCFSYQLCLRYGTRLDAGDHEHDFTARSELLTGLLQLRDGSAPEFLELLRQLPRDNGWSVCRARRCKRRQRRSNPIRGFEHHGGDAGCNYVSDRGGALPTLSWDEAEKSESVERQSRSHECGHDRRRPRYRHHRDAGLERRVDEP